MTAKSKTKPTDLLVDQPLDRFKVGIVEQRLIEFTVYAHDENEAVQLVQRGHGRHAGQHGPEIAEILCKRMGGFDDPETNLTINPEPKSKLIIPSGGF